MGIASFSHTALLSAVMAPLHAFAALWVPAPPAPMATSLSVPASLRSTAGGMRSATKNIAVSARSLKATSTKPCQPLVKTASPRRLKVVREFEAGISPSSAGRMVISGRMADVCAELERMAQRETGAQAA